MTDDLLQTFRSDVPLPDETTAQRIYERATRSRRRVVTRPRLALAAAALGAAVGAVFFTGVLGGRTVAPPTQVRGHQLVNSMKVRFTASDHAFTSITVTLQLESSDGTVHVRVLRSDASQVPQAYHTTSHVVFQEQVPVTGSTWSATLLPSDWEGGCQNALYEIEATVYPVGSSIANQSDTTPWFECHGSFADPANPFPNSFSN